MIEFQKALKAVLSQARTCTTEQVDLLNAHRRILAKDIAYDTDIPPYDKSAMDGYACRSADLGNELTILETIYAGNKPQYEIGRNECAKIMTGAVVPDGADCVFIKEVAEETGENRVRCNSPGTPANICYRGEDVKTGDVAIRKHTLITSRHIPLLAGAGVMRPEVFSRPDVSLFSTGSELVEPDAKPLPHQIRNSNAYQLVAQLDAMGIRGTYNGIISDNEEETYEKLKKTLGEYDVVILSGGVSEGDSDFIPRVLGRLNFEIRLTRIAMQPGKPILFATDDRSFCFGLAGNPVSSFIQFELYVKPFIYEMMGHSYNSPSQAAFLAKPVQRKKADRLKFIPGILNNNNVVTPVEFHGSAHIDALSRANCLIDMPVGVLELKQGDSVDVRPL